MQIQEKSVAQLLRRLGLGEGMGQIVWQVLGDRFDEQAQANRDPLRVVHCVRRFLFHPIPPASWRRRNGSMTGPAGPPKKGWPAWSGRAWRRPSATGLAPAGQIRLGFTSGAGAEGIPPDPVGNLILAGRHTLHGPPSRPFAVGPTETSSSFPARQAGHQLVPIPGGLGLTVAGKLRT